MTYKETQEEYKKVIRLLGDDLSKEDRKKLEKKKMQLLDEMRSF